MNEVYQEEQEKKHQQLLENDAQIKCKTCDNSRNGKSYYCKECYDAQAKRMSSVSRSVPSYVKVANEVNQEAKTYE